jgi:uncharacterized membrane protein
VSALHILSSIAVLGLLLGTLADIAFVALRNRARIAAALRAEDAE